MYHITGDSVSKEQVTALAEKMNFKLWPSESAPFMTTVPGQTFPKHLSVLADNITEEKLHLLFEMPIVNIIDANCLQESIEDYYRHKKATNKGQSIGFILTCPVIYACDVAQIFTEALNKRLNFTPSRYGNIHLALHEALVNGLIHGNLQISSDLRQSAKDYVKYSQILKDRLTDPAYARKSISIWANWDAQKLEIKIRDEGAGYSISTTMEKKPDTKAKSGRGLKMIASTADSCTIEDFGREITLSFAFDEPEHYQVSEALVESADEVSHFTADLSDCRVLVMEDNLSNQTLVARLLNVVGITKIDMAVDGIEGLHKVIASPPDLIILDITMPRMNGYEVLHHLKSVPQTADIPVLIQTASDTRETRDKTFSSGATDFISKPINPLEFFARVKVHLENRLLVKDLEGKLKQIDEELRGAQKVQTDMLPSEQTLKNFQKKYGLQIAHFFAPSSKLGGDFWQLFPISSTRAAVYLCDFSGHGVAAALNTVRLHTLITQMNKGIGGPAAFLQKLNDQLYGLLPRGHFATFFCAVIDIEKQTLSYSGAGAPAPLLCSCGDICALKTKGMPLGIVRRPVYDEVTVPFKPGDNLLMFSDAFTESPNEEGERLGDEGFEKMAFKPLCEDNPEQIVAQIMADFFEFAPPPPPDDATAVLVRFNK